MTDSAVMQQDILVKYHDGMEKYPLKMLLGSAGIDLYAAEDVHVDKGGNFKLVSLGVSIKVPKGYCCFLMARSSSYRRYHFYLANGVGLIDQSYCGNGDVWKLPIISSNTFDVNIKKGDKIAQAFIIPDLSNMFQLVTVTDMKDPDRGGFGSTGDK